MALPDRLNRIERKLLVAGNDGEAFTGGLSNQQAVERVGVMKRQSRYRKDVPASDVELSQAKIPRVQIDKRLDGMMQFQFAALGFDHDLPNRDGAEIELVYGV